MYIIKFNRGGKANVLPLIIEGEITRAINKVILKRKDELKKNYESLAERAAEKAFDEKRYKDVVMHYSKIFNLNQIQKKRLDISMKN